MKDAQMHKNTDAPMHQSTETPMHQNTNRTLRVTISIPEDLYQGICSRAAKLRTTKTDVIEELLRAGVREVANFTRLRKDLNTPITAMTEEYKKYCDNKLRKELKPEKQDSMVIDDDGEELPDLEPAEV